MLKKAKLLGLTSSICLGLWSCRSPNSRNSLDGNSVAKGINEDTASYSDIAMHYKYGSTGTDKSLGIPYWLFRALPTVCKDLLPGGWESIGMIMEKDRDLPIGFSKRKSSLGVDNVGFNCALCHAGAARSAPGEKQRIFLGAGNHALSIADYTVFVQDCVTDPTRTSPLKLSAYFASQQDFPQGQQGEVHKQTIFAILEQLRGPYGALKKSLEPLFNGNRIAMHERAGLPTNNMERFDRRQVGRGQTDAFNVIGITAFQMPPNPSIGTSDWPSIWNGNLKQPKTGKKLLPYVHWDGNQQCEVERDSAATISSGAKPEEVEMESVKRIRDWMAQLRPPKYTEFFPVNWELAREGKKVFMATCNECHGPSGQKVGLVTPLSQIGTDSGRQDVVTVQVLKAFEFLKTTDEYEIHNTPPNTPCLRKTNGYVNRPLMLVDSDKLDQIQGEGLFLSGPYLHNGTIPNLAELLEPEERRSREPFCSGSDTLDPIRVGYSSVCNEQVYSATGELRTQSYFKVETHRNGQIIKGYSNRGHSGPSYGTSLPPEQKRALLEFLKLL